MEKAGGIRAMIAGIEVAHAAGLKVWLGTMVGSSLNSGTTAHLMPLALHGDLDGSLLVTADSDKFSGGFAWGEQDSPNVGHIILPDLSTAGTGLTPK